MAASHFGVTEYFLSSTAMNKIDRDGQLWEVSRIPIERTVTKAVPRPSRTDLRGAKGAYRLTQGDSV